ncbi:MAG: hypothetical protein II350_08380 [Clostridia bacterium]|nr:hypothetical protein [Clostridia bacterium]
MESIITAIIGIVCIVIGISNRKGNISLLHSYHRKRVPEEDRIPFGKLVGLGMIIIGIALTIGGGLNFAAVSLQENLYSILGTVVMVAGLISGLGVSFFAMFKYNKGIF